MMVQDRDLARSSNDSEYGKRTKTRAARPGRLDKRNARGRPGARAPGRGPPGARFRPIGGGLTLITQVVTLCKPYGGFNTVDPGPRGGGGPRGARAARPRAPDADRRREPDVGPPGPPATGGRGRHDGLRRTGTRIGARCRSTEIRYFGCVRRRTHYQRTAYARHRWTLPVVSSATARCGGDRSIDASIPP